MIKIQERNLMFEVHYSDDEHDYLVATVSSLFEATCEYYYALDDLQDNEWATIYHGDTLIKES